MKKLKLLVMGITLTTAVITTHIMAATPMTTTVTTAEISTLATIATIDKDEILLGIVALHKHASSNINQFADMMINQHGANLTKVLEIANQLHALPLTSAMADQFIAEGDNDITTLGALKGVQFDKAYVNAMVTGHEGALNLIDTQFMQTATNPKIKKFLVATRATVVMHLEHAKKLQQNMQS